MGHGRAILGPSALWALSTRLHRGGHPTIARIVKLVIYLLYKAILPPEAAMDGPPNLMHLGLGVVVHPTTVFGRGVTLAQHVTIAASPADEQGHVHPVLLGNDVFVGAGAVLIARRGPLRLGDGAVVGAGSVVLDDVPAGGRAFSQAARITAPTDRPSAGA